MAVATTTDSRYRRRLIIGLANLAIAAWWRLRGTLGDEIFPGTLFAGFRWGDLVTIPICLIGLVLLASRPGASWFQRVGGSLLLMLSVAWVTSKNMDLGPTLWTIESGHGIHSGDLPAVVPGLLGFWILAVGY